VEQPLAGKVKIAGSPIRLSETPGKIYAHAPLLGEHTGKILQEVLGYSHQEIERLTAEGVVN